MPDLQKTPPTTKKLDRAAYHRKRRARLRRHRARSRGTRGRAAR